MFSILSFHQFQQLAKVQVARDARNSEWDLTELPRTWYREIEMPCHSAAKPRVSIPDPSHHQWCRSEVLFPKSVHPSSWIPQEEPHINRANLAASASMGTTNCQTKVHLTSTCAYLFQSQLVVPEGQQTWQALTQRSLEWKIELRWPRSHRPKQGWQKTLASSYQ